MWTCTNFIFFRLCVISFQTLMLHINPTLMIPFILAMLIIVYLSSHCWYADDMTAGVLSSQLCTLLSSSVKRDGQSLHGQKMAGFYSTLTNHAQQYRCGRHGLKLCCWWCGLQETYGF